MKDQIKILKEEVDQFKAEAGPQKFDAIIHIADGKGPHVPFEYKITGIEAADEDEAYDIACKSALVMHKYEGPRPSYSPRVLTGEVRPEGDDFEPTAAQLDAYNDR